MTDGLELKRDGLYDILWLLGQGGLVVCYSGGSDSTLLAAAARDAGVQPLLLLTFVTPTTSRFDRESAKATAARLQLPLRVAELDTLIIPEVAQNSRERCYHCKLALYREAWRIAHEEGYAQVADGGNRDDLAALRPGNRAVAELGVRQPLAEAELTKAEIRRLASRMCLPNADRPASPCLASRFPYGTYLTPELLAQVEQGEDLLRQRGLRSFRLRAHQGLARLEVAREEAPQVLRLKDQISEGLHELGFFYITLDLEDFASGRFDRG
jgi:pyridinium-3,5-biscarboxylic acid mononucleotide sulfurtransferase